jgi:hypothetical protein
MAWSSLTKKPFEVILTRLLDLAPFNIYIIDNDLLFLGEVSLEDTSRVALYIVGILGEVLMLTSI